MITPKTCPGCGSDTIVLVTDLETDERFCPACATKQEEKSGGNMGKQTKITPTILRKHAQRLIAAGKMPSPERLLEVIAETREKYAEKILEARKADQRRVQ